MPFMFPYLNDEINQLTLTATDKTVTTWAIDCAFRVLPLFESNFPLDNRPRLALETARAWARDEVKMWETRKFAFAAHAAACDAKSYKNALLG